MKLQTDPGVPILFHATHASRTTFNPEIHVRGSHGQLTMTHKSVTIQSKGKGPVVIETGGPANERQAMLDAVLAAIKGTPSFYCNLDMASRQTEAVEMIHAIAPIQTIAGETLDLGTPNERTIWPGLDDMMHAAFKNECLLK
jgi:hypothetical protein